MLSKSALNFLKKYSPDWKNSRLKNDYARLLKINKSLKALREQVQILQSLALEEEKNLQDEFFKLAPRILDSNEEEVSYSRTVYYDESDALNPNNIFRLKDVDKNGIATIERRTGNKESYIVDLSEIDLHFGQKK